MVARLGIESMHGMPEIAVEISGLSENSDRNDGIKTNLRALRKRCGGNLCLPVLACVAGFEMGRGREEEKKGGVLGRGAFLLHLPFPF